jgi:hypothetical protein
VRTDTSRSLTTTLAEHLARGELLIRRTDAIASESELASWRHDRRTWALQCTEALAEVFEAEAVEEFVHALTMPAGERDLRAAAKAERDATRRALELTRALLSTL